VLPATPLRNAEKVVEKLSAGLAGELAAVAAQAALVSAFHAVHENHPAEEPNLEPQHV